MGIPAHIAALCLLAASVAPAAIAQEHHARPPEQVFRRQALAGNVHALYGRGGNVGFFVAPDAVLVVDSQFKDIAPGIVAEIQKVTNRPVK